MIDSEKIELLERIKAMKEELKKLEAMITEPEVEDAKKQMKDEIKNAEEELKEKLNKEIEKFNSDSEKINKNIERIKATLILEISVDKMDVTEALVGLTDELKEFENEANSLINDIEVFKEEINKEGLNLSIKDIKNRVKEFKTRLVTLKREQIEKYNIRVEYTNKILAEYKAKVPVNTEVYEYVNGIEVLSVCGATVADWRQNSYLLQLDYKKIIEINNQIKSIDEKLELMNNLFEEFELGIEFIKDKTIELEVLVSDKMSDLELTDAQSKFNNLFDLLLNFGTKLEDARVGKKLTEEELVKLNGKYQSVMVSYLSIQKTLGMQVTKEETEYDKMSKTVDSVGLDVNNFSLKVDALYGLVDYSLSELFNKESLSLVSRFKKIKIDVQKAYDEKVIDDNQYKSLNDRIVYIENKLNETYLKLKNIKMYMLPEDAVFKFLNNSVLGLEQAIDALEKRLDLLEKPIKDRHVRKEIDSIFKKLELEIKQLEKQLEVYKETDLEKYNETKERLDNSKKKLEVLGKKYRRKCPLLVKTVKSAKHFFKKYKKILLIIAGLVAFAMMAHTIIIPAIIHGNIMLAKTVPMLRGPLKVINNLLGGMIGSPINMDKIAFMSESVKFASSAAAIKTLLQGVAMSGFGSAALIAPIVIMIKKLSNKINKVELKQKFVDGKDAVVNGVKKGKDKIAGKVKNKVEEVKTKVEEVNDNRKNKKIDSLAKKEMRNSIKNIIDDYSKSGLTVEEYCKENNIEGFLVDVLKIYDNEVKKNRENLDNRKGGRK